MPIVSSPHPILPLTRGPRAHFFGYYDKSPWNSAGDRVLVLEAPAESRMPLPGERIGIGIVALGTGVYEQVATTAAWNWQQGAMIQWLPGDTESVLFNDVREGQALGIILDLTTGRETVLPLPVYHVAKQHHLAVSLNFARLARTRPVIGYINAQDRWPNELTPDGDGVWSMDLRTGKTQLVFSLARAASLWPQTGMAGVEHRFEHATLNPSGGRFFVLQRWPRAANATGPHAKRPFVDRLISVGLDGSSPHRIADEGFASHMDWKDDRTILGWVRRNHRDGFWEMEDVDLGAAGLIGDGLLTSDAHGTYSPDRRFILGDEYNGRKDGCQGLWIFDLGTSTRYDLATVASPPPFNKGDLRCDLHPRWNHDGTQISFDSVHEGSRQLYAIRVDDITGSASRHQAMG